MRRREFCHRLASAAFVAGPLLSCRERHQPPQGGADRLRIVSLSPAISDTLLELGLADEIVAVGDGDDLLADRPSVGRFVDLDLEQLISLDPTHVLAMTGRQGLSDAIRQLASRQAFELHDLAYPQNVAGCIASMTAVGAAVGRSTAGYRLARRVGERLKAIGELTDFFERHSTLLVFGETPLMAAGSGTVLDELLSIAGGTNAAAGLNSTAPILDDEALISLSPEVVILLQPRGPGTRSRQPGFGHEATTRLTSLGDWRVRTIDDLAALLPGPSISRTAGSLAGMLHPALQPPILEIFDAAD